MKKYTITDTIEVGHSKFTGGTVDITFEFDHIIDPLCYYKIIDYLDHSLITDNDQFIKYSKRYFLLSECKNIFEDIHNILSYFAYSLTEINFSENKYENNVNLTVKINKESYTAPLYSGFYFNLIRYSTEG